MLRLLSFAFATATLAACDNTLSGIILMDPPLETGDTGLDTGAANETATVSIGHTGHTGTMSTTAETGFVEHTGHTGVITTHTGDTGPAPPERLCVRTNGLVTGYVDLYVYNDTTNDRSQWFGGVPLASGPAGLLCGDLNGRSSGDALFVQGSWNDGVNGRNLIEDDGSGGVIDNTLFIALDGTRIDSGSYAQDPLLHSEPFAVCTTP